MPFTSISFPFSPFGDRKKELLHPLRAELTSTPHQGDAGEWETTRKGAYCHLYQLY